jgi:hypothetical protein
VPFRGRQLPLEPDVPDVPEEAPPSPVPPFVVDEDEHAARMRAIDAIAPAVHNPSLPRFMKKSS